MVCCFPQEPLTSGLHLGSTSLASVKNFKNAGTNNVPLLSDEFSVFLLRHTNNCQVKWSHFFTLIK